MILSSLPALTDKVINEFDKHFCNIFFSILKQKELLQNCRYGETTVRTYKRSFFLVYLKEGLSKQSFSIWIIPKLIDDTYLKNYFSLNYMFCIHLLVN